MTSRLGRQIQEAVGGLDAAGIGFALIGGLALASHRVIRATRDVDLLIDLEHADHAGEVLEGLGYQCVHRSDEAANYRRGDEHVDLLLAHRPIARRLLAEATPRDTPFGTLRVVSAEGLIGFKLQVYVNDPERTQDLEDIKALLRENRQALNLDEVREYFRVFEREADLDALLQSTS